MGGRPPTLMVVAKAGLRKSGLPPVCIVKLCRTLLGDQKDVSAFGLGGADEVDSAVDAPDG